MIYRALIVDDERYIADTTAMRLREAEDWMMDVSVAYGGAEALAHARANKTDLLIADIRMPGMDGIELAREVGRLWPACQTVLLTAHSEFEYVYRAIKQERVDYVLKQDGFDALLTAVKKAVARFDSALSRERLLSAAGAREALPWLQREFLLDIAHGAKLSAEALAEAQTRLALDVDLGKPLAVVGVFLHDGDRAALFARIERMQTIDIAVRRQLPEGMRAQCLQLDERRMLWLMQSEGVCPPLDGVLEGAQDVVLTSLRTAASFTYVARSEGPAAFAESYARIMALQTARLLAGERVWLLEAEGNDDPAVAAARLSNDAARWRRAFEAGASDEETIFNALTERLADVKTIHAPAYARMYLALAAPLASLAAGMGLRREGLDEPFSQPDPFAAAEYLRGVAHRLRAARADCAAANESELVGRVRQYVEEHLREVTLQSLADAMHMNASYLSRAYKLSAGENLIAYLTAARLSRAKALLSEPGHKMQEISSALGFANPAYFSFFFKKHAGVAPRDWRNNS